MAKTLWSFGRSECNRVLKDLSCTIICVRKPEFFVDGISVFNVIEILVEHGTICHALEPMTYYICYHSN